VRELGISIQSVKYFSQNFEKEIHGEFSCGSLFYFMSDHSSAIAEPATGKNNRPFITAIKNRQRTMGVSQWVSTPVYLGAPEVACLH
jgi:hypothetical protein